VGQGDDAHEGGGCGGPSVRRFHVEARSGVACRGSEAEHAVISGVRAVA
jgi:hypothetical protein